MKVLQIDVNYGNSSTGEIVKNLHLAMLKEKIESFVFFGRGIKSNENNVKKFSFDFETYIHALLTRITGLVGYFSFFSTNNLINKIKKINPDIIHIHELHAYFINHNKLLKFLKENNFKTMFTFHCEYMYTGKCGHAYDCDGYTKNCGNCPLLKEYPKSLYFDRTTQMLNDKKFAFKDFNNLRVFTPSEWLKERVKKSFFHDRDIQCIYNGIDTNIFNISNNSSLNLNYKYANKKIVLTVGSNIMSPSKGGNYIFELAKRFINDNIVFVIVGVEKNIVNEFENVITLEKIQNKKKLASLYKNANLTLIASKKETFSLVVAESLACGTPVIGFDSGAPKEIAPEPFGFFVEYGNLDALENTLRDKISIKNKNFSNEVSKYVYKNFSKEIMAKKYIDTYREFYTE